MNKAEYLTFHEKCCTKMTAITRAKNADYTGTGDDPFANFTRVEALGVCSTEQGFLTRMTDKLSRLSSFVQRGQLLVKDESAEDTLLDLANYCLLMAAYLRSKHPTVVTNSGAPLGTTSPSAGAPIVYSNHSTIAAQMRAP